MNCKLESCGKEITNYQRGTRQFCDKVCYKIWKKLHGKKYERKKPRNLPTKEFIMRMKLSDYTDTEIETAFKKYVKCKNMLDVVKCRCDNNQKCYPHYLQEFRESFEIV